MNPISRVRSGILPALALLMALPQATAAQSPTVVDTMKAIYVTGKKVTLEEIIERCLQGERTKLSGHTDITYRITVRNVIHWKKKRHTEDTVMRAYADANGNNRLVLLADREYKEKLVEGEWVEDEDADTEPLKVRTTEGISDFENLPFFLEDVEEYDFELLERRLEVDRVIFKIAFKPKSDFKALPSGTVYVDTRNYRIIHEEFCFDKNPFPLMLKGIDRVSRHWMMLPGGEWVFNKILFEVDIRTDPFGFMPYKASAAMVRDQFEFDKGYDARLFGSYPGMPEGPAHVTTAAKAPEVKEASPTTALTARVPMPDTPGPDVVVPEPVEGTGRDLLAELQHKDESYYAPETIALRLDYTDEVTAQHDSLGLEGFTDAMHARQPFLRPDWGIATRLWDYNRTEGLVLGLRGELEGRRRDDGPRIRVDGAWATSSQKFRHREELIVPFQRRRWRLGLEGFYQDRVDPYGSNRPTLNWARALIGGADEQDYLRRQGGAAGLRLSFRDDFSVGGWYAVHEERSVEGRTDFSFFGNPGKFNAPIDEGIERALVARIAREPQSDRRFSVVLEGRYAGGEIGGDFDYSRADVVVNWRRYLIRRHEIVTRALYAHTWGSPPVQRVADVGGLSTVRGYGRRVRVGDTSLAGRIEYLMPYDIFGRLHLPVLGEMGVQFVPWADAARVWQGNSDDWIHSIGIGFQTFLGGFSDASNLRLDLSFPTGPDAPDDWRLDLHFTPAYF